MRVYTGNLVGYLKAVFFESWQKVFSFFDLLGVVLFLYPNLANKLAVDEVIIRSIGGGIFFVSFVLANYKVYLNLCVNGADIRLSTYLQHFSTDSTGRNPFRGIEASPDGFNDHGLPCWATLYAQIKTANIGFERGIFRWEIVRSKTKFPSLFNMGDVRYDFRPGLNIPERTSRNVDLFVDLLFTVQDPRLFARQLKKLSKSKERYRLVIRYLTQRVDGETKPKELKIEGGFADFCTEIIDHWHRSGFDELASLYQS
jgi:hypothetical protein